MSHNFKAGMEVFIHSCKKSSDHIGLDGDGVMKSMVGQVWKLTRTGLNRTYIKSPNSDFVFTWHPDDMRKVIIEESKPIIVDFDVKWLDV